MDDEQIKQMREAMVKEWGLGAFSSEQQDEYIDKIGGLLYQKIILRTTGEMTDAELDALDAFMGTQGETPDLPATLDYLRQHVTDFDTIAHEESDKLKEELLVPEH